MRQMTYLIETIQSDIARQMISLFGRNNPITPPNNRTARTVIMTKRINDREKLC